MVVRRSGIHSRGLFAARTIQPGEMVIEYCGEVIRPVLTDAREKLYESRNIGCYMFRVGGVCLSELRGAFAVCTSRLRFARTGCALHGQFVVSINNAWFA